MSINRRLHLVHMLAGEDETTLFLVPFQGNVAHIWRFVLRNAAQDRRLLPDWLDRRSCVRCCCYIRYIRYRRLADVRRFTPVSTFRACCFWAGVDCGFDITADILSVNDFAVCDRVCGPDAVCCLVCKVCTPSQLFPDCVFHVAAVTIKAGINFTILSIGQHATHVRRVDHRIEGPANAVCAINTGRHVLIRRWNDDTGVVAVVAQVDRLDVERGRGF